MNQKIEWYREVLEIEPNSKIFFPLARMLVKAARPDEAITILRQGIGRHPDHIEARLFLVELLYASGKILDLHQEVDVLSVLFKNYPGFWRAWGERLFDDEGTRDAGLAAIFLAAFLQNASVSWAGVIEHGLKSLVGGTASSPASVAESHPLAQPKAAPLKETAPPPPVLPVEVVSAVATDFVDSVAVDEDDDEPITLRTRSMADVLAEQGDVAGALDIYNELLTASTGDAERMDLQARIDALSGKNTGAESGAEERTPQEEKKDWLAALAQRLEARSLQ